MPPRAAGSRRPRFSSREPDTPNQNASMFQKPNLPPLQGTPSSRRQFSYGAEVEPMASRPGHGLQRNQVVDLSSAVRNVLTRPEDDDELQDTGATPQRQGRPQHFHQLAEVDADELADPQQPLPTQPSCKRSSIKVVKSLSNGLSRSVWHLCCWTYKPLFNFVKESRP